MSRLGERGIAQILIMLILLAGIVAGIFLVQSQGNFFTQFLPKAGPGETITIVDDNGLAIKATTSQTVKVKLASPVWLNPTPVNPAVASPTSATNYSLNASYLNWKNSQGALADDSIYANVPDLGPGKLSNVLAAGKFGFTIPSEASISGVLVEIKKGAVNGTGVVDKDIRIGIGRQLLSIENKAKPEVWSTTESYVSYGGENDLWGMSLTPAQV